MVHQNIIIQNAHTNNLKNISLSIPKHRLVVFTGVSGSGKSSLLFDTVYTEARRQLIETFSTFARTRMPKLSRPDVDDIMNLSTAIIIDQKRMGNNLRSTVGTATEINTYLRLLYSRVAQPFIGPSFFFSFNHPEGMCPHCHGLGKKVTINLEKFLNQDLSLREGAITHPHYKTGSFMWKELIATKLFDNDKKLHEFSKEEIEYLLYSPPVPISDSKQKLAYTKNFEGIARKLVKAVTGKAEDELPDEEQNVYNRYFIYDQCDECNGSRLNERARSVTLNGLTLDTLCHMELTDVLNFLSQIDDEISRPILRKAIFLLEQLIETGVSYLSLDRTVSTLSGGESQRVKMARQLDCNLTDMLYVLDEPSIGLHPRDTEKLLAILHRLKDKGNSVFVVEHDPDIINAAEWIIDMGPGAGSQGGTVVYNGEAAGIRLTDSITARYLKRPKQIEYNRRKPAGFYEIREACINNLKNLNVKIPKGILTCITGVAGSGKSSLIHGCFASEHPEAVIIDQSPIGKTSRANAATYIGVFNLIRKAFARATQHEASLFSFNSKGACPKCNGQGTLSFDLHFLDEVRMVCDACEGRRYNADVLKLKMSGHNIADVLNMTVNQAMEYFSDKAIRKHLGLLQDVGLGYLKLGQSLSSLSGGESQRLKIATELNYESNIYIMDEPTTGLHLSDTENFIGIITKLVENHNTVVIIEHNPEIIRYADWVIDMGPEGGKKGGEILFEGTPGELIKCPDSYTGQYLAAYLSH